MNLVSRRSHHYQWLGPACGSKRPKCFKLLSTLTPIRETNIKHIGHKYNMNQRQIYTEMRRQIWITRSVEARRAPTSSRRWGRVNNADKNKSMRIVGSKKQKSDLIESFCKYWNYVVRNTFSWPCLRNTVLLLKRRGNTNFLTDSSQGWIKILFILSLKHCRVYWALAEKKQWLPSPSTRVGEHSCSRGSFREHVIYLHRTALYRP